MTNQQQPMYEIPLSRTANQPVSEGIHSFQIRDIEEGESSNNNPMWTVRLTCLDEGPDSGKEVTLWLVLTESARWKMEKFLDAVNAPVQGSGNYKNFLSRKLRAQITHKNQDGRILANVGEMFPYATAAPKPAAPAVVARASSGPASRTGAGGPATTKVKPTSKGLPADVTGEEGEQY